MNRYAKNPDVNHKGFYVIEHVPTGKFWTGTSKKNMLIDIDAIFIQLKTCSHENLEFQHLWDKEPHFKVHIHRVTHIDDAKLRERTFRGSRQLYLLINRNDTRERRRKSDKVLKSIVD